MLIYGPCSFAIATRCREFQACNEIQLPLSVLFHSRCGYGGDFICQEPEEKTPTDRLLKMPRTPSEV